MPSDHAPRVLDHPLVRPLVDRFLVEDRDHALVLLDPDGVIVGWLGGAQRLFGFSAEQAIGRPIDSLFLPDDRVRHQAQAELDAARRTGRAEDDRWHLRQDGAAVWINGTVSALHDETGQVIGFVKLMRDRTDLRTQIETLEARNAGLQQRLDAATLMLRTLGHELRNPLAPMVNAAAILDRTVGAPAAVPNGILRRQMAVLQRLADDLMDFSRVDSGRLELRLSSFAVQDLLRDVAASHAQAASANGVHLELLLPDAPILVRADRERLQQVVVNLVDNALRHNGPGQKVVLRTVQEPPDAVIRVEDDGIGIPPDALPRIFELFTRGDGGHDTHGLGIGLALAKQIVEMHGGSIEARSPGVHQGASFTVRIPMRSRAA